MMMRTVFVVLLGTASYLLEQSLVTAPPYQKPNGNGALTPPSGPGPNANGLTAAPQLSTTPCTQVDHSVEGLEDPNILCLEDYLQSAQTTCPQGDRQTSVTSYLGTPCTEKKNVPTYKNLPICVPKHLNKTGPTYRDQPVNGALYRRVSGGENGPFIKCNRTALSPSQALRNAKPAIDNRMYYAQCGPLSRWQGSRMDCVGLVTRAWNLVITAAYTVDDLHDMSDPLPSCWDARPGDIVTTGNHHVGLVHHWVLRDRANPASSFMTWEAADVNLGHIQGSRTIHQIERDKMICRRFKCISEAVEIPRPTAPIPQPPGPGLGNPAPPVANPI